MTRLLPALLILPQLLTLTAQADVLVLIVERDGGESAFWWAAPDAPAPTALDALLWESGEPWLDPRALADPPSVSRIYLVPDLNDVGARNLGGLFGADRVVVGELDLPPAQPTAAEVAQVVSGVLRYRLLSVSGTTAEVVERPVVGIGPTEAAAAEDLRRQAAAALTEAAAPPPRAATIEPDPTAPELLFRGLTDATPLVALLAQLRAHSDVIADLREDRALPGLLAIAVALRPGRNADDLARVLETLAAAPDWGYQLWVGPREGNRLTVQLQPAPLPPPALPPAP